MYHRIYEVDFTNASVDANVEKHHSHEVPNLHVDVEVHVVQPQNFTIEVEGDEPFKLHEEIIIVMQS
jgi:hypothetical protein